MMAVHAAMHDLTATEVAAQYASGALSPVDVTRACLARIEACEPRLNAMYRVSRETALQAARASEARWRAKQPLSPLDGVPATIKENIYTRGDPAPIGTRANDDAAPQPQDAPPAARLREGGCVILGKTTMPDFGMLSSGLSSLHGVTRNPWNLERNTSGSSSGAGAACAAGYAPLHLGTDIGGSVRLPATHCGIFALKPSLGRVPVYPPYIGRVTGPMTRDVAASAALMNLLSRPDARDFMSLPYEATDFSRQLDWYSNEELKPLRIAFLADMKVGLPVHPEVRAAAAAAAKALEAAGAQVEEIASFLTPEVSAGMEKFFEARLYNDYLQMPPARQAKVLPFIAEWCSWRAKSFSGRDVMAAYSSYVALREVTTRATLPYDFVVSPVSPILPYGAELPSPNNDPHDALPHIAFTVPYNMSEQPAASLNWSFSKDGLPIGVQVIGRRFDDAGVLRLARLLERLRPAPRPWPNPV
ncbi:MAG TPA: amidase [Burkholderiales bacterium]|nr:amidase [Burkholderiales bacterium]